MFSYVYVLKCLINDLYYIGSRCSKTPPHEDLLHIYTTSSKVVNAIIHDHGIKSFHVIKVKMFNTYTDAVLFEDKILRQIKNKNKFLNMNFSAGGQIIKSKTHTFITSDGENFLQYPRELELPIGYWIEWPFKPPSRKGYTKVTNGECIKYIKPCDIIPVGFYNIAEWRARTPIAKRSTKNTQWINNGKTNSRISKNEDIPNGWVQGRMKFYSPKRIGKSTTKDKEAINNGCANKFIDRGSLIPEGWVKGLLRPPRVVINLFVVNGITYSNYKEASKAIGKTASCFTQFTKKYNTNKSILKNGRLCPIE